MTGTVRISIDQFKSARELLLHVMHRITPIANIRTDAVRATAAARMGHIAALADLGAIGVIAGETPFAMGEWKEKTGFSIPHPGLDRDVQDWMTKVEFDVHVMHQYVMAVMERIDELLDGADDAMMATEFDFGPMGKMTVMGFINLATAMMYRTSGEISVIRQINGLDDGYPR